MNDLREALSRLDTAAISDARDRLGLRPGVAHGLGRLSGGPALYGRVVTVELVRIDPIDDSMTKSTRHLCTAAVDASGPGDVLVVAHGGRTEMAGWGGVLSTAATMRAIEGVIVDGAVRDLDEALDLDFTVFAAAVVPVTARGRVRERDWNVPVEIAGVTVTPGDWVVADSSGVVFIEAAHAEAVVGVAAEIGAREQAMVGRLNAGVPVSEVMGTNYENMLGEM